MLASQRQNHKDPTALRPLGRARKATIALLETKLYTSDNLTGGREREGGGRMRGIERGKKG